MSQCKRLGHNIPCLCKSRNSLLSREPQGSCIHFSFSPLHFHMSWTRVQLLLLQIDGQESLLVWTIIGWSNKKRLSVHKPCLTGKIHSSDVAFSAEGSWLLSSLPGLISHRLTVVRSKFRTHLYKKRLLFDSGTRKQFCWMQNPISPHTQAESQHLYRNPALFQNFVSHVDTNQNIESALKNLPTHSKWKEERDE